MLKAAGCLAQAELGGRIEESRIPCRVFLVTPWKPDGHSSAGASRAARDTCWRRTRKPTPTIGPFFRVFASCATLPGTNLLLNRVLSGRAVDRASTYSSRTDSVVQPHNPLEGGRYAAVQRAVAKADLFADPEDQSSPKTVSSMATEEVIGEARHDSRPPEWLRSPKARRLLPHGPSQCRAVSSTVKSAAAASVRKSDAANALGIQDRHVKPKLVHRPPDSPG